MTGARRKRSGLRRFDDRRDDALHHRQHGQQGGKGDDIGPRPGRHPLAHEIGRHADGFHRGDTGNDEGHHQRHDGGHDKPGEAGGNLFHAAIIERSSRPTNLRNGRSTADPDRIKSVLWSCHSVAPSQQVLRNGHRAN